MRRQVDFLKQLIALPPNKSRQTVSLRYEFVGHGDEKTKTNQRYEIVRDAHL